MVEVDDGIEFVRRLDKARLLIKTPSRPFIQHTIKVHIQGEVYIVHVVEESAINSETCRYRRGSVYGSSEEIELAESDAGTTSFKELSLMSATEGESHFVAGASHLAVTASHVAEMEEMV